MLLAVGASAHCQCAADQSPSATKTAYEQHDWAAVIQSVQSSRLRTSEENFEYGMALAHLARWPQARSALLLGYHQCSQQERFSVELAGIAFQMKDYKQSALWLRRALRLSPQDTYAVNFAATVYFLMGNLDAALKYWNRLHKPYITELRLDPRFRVQRQLLDRSFAFAPASTLDRSQYANTKTRLGELGIFPAFNINLLSRQDGTFDAQFSALERNGFGGSRVQAVLSTFGGAVYETIYPSYFNLGRSAINIESLLRWDAQKRRAWVSMGGPWHQLPQWHWQLGADVRNENWAIRRSASGTSPELGSLNLERQVASASVTGMPHGSLRWSTGLELSHRSFRSVMYGSALSAGLVSPGFAVKHLADVRSTLLDIPERRFNLTGAASSQFTRLWSSPPRLYEKLDGAVTARWFPQATDDVYEARQQFRAGRAFGSPSFDELYMLGVERDNDLWLRGMIGTRDGRKGSSPLATSYVLSNSDFLRRFYSNGLVSIKAGPWLDMGRAAAPTVGLSPRQWLFSAGVATRITVLGTGIVLTWGRDLRAGTNAFYGTLAAPGT